jgi:GxxExxY protein
MNTDEHRFLTQEIIECAFKVSNALGIGFLEKVYENSLIIELKRKGLSVASQPSLKVYYQGFTVGEYTPDLIVDRKVLVELKVAKCIDENHEAQLLNYLRISQIRIGMILNFGTPKLGIKRMIL